MKTIRIVVPANFAVPATIANLAKLWELRENTNATHNWQFAAAMYLFMQAHPDVTQQDIGAALGKIRRGKPYSKSTISKMLGALKAHPKCPADFNAARKFNAAFHGVSESRGKKGEEMTQDEAIKAAICFAKKAVKTGATAESVMDRIAEGIAAEDESAGDDEA